MPFTIITLKSVPKSLRGDLTKWMQEIATGVYVGNFNSRVREKLWKRVKESVKEGEPTLSYAYRNEIGYLFDTINTHREVVDFDGIPLIRIALTEESQRKELLGFSKAAKFRKAQKYAIGVWKKQAENEQNREKKNYSYVVIDIETDGLDEENCSILELGAYKVNPSGAEEFHSFIEYCGTLPQEIKELTGITEEGLKREGKPSIEVMKGFLAFIGDCALLGYAVDFDLRFINDELRKLGLPLIKNKRYDLLQYVKKEKMFLHNYKLQTVLKEYGIEEKVPHRALQDAKLIYQLSTKVNKFKRSLGEL